MRVSRLRLVPTMLAALLSACSSGVTDAKDSDSLPDNTVGGATSKAVRQQLRDGAWTFAVDRAFQVGSVPVAFPSTPLPEAGYVPISAATSYRFTVSAGGARIDVAEPRLAGRLEKETSEQLVYDVVEGSITGGRIVVSRNAAGGLQAELTIFGSGLPVVRSERGLLRAAP